MTYKRVMILFGVTVGDGAIIGAASVVTQGVPAWAIADGNPGRSFRNRPGDGATAEFQAAVLLLFWIIFEVGSLTHVGPFIYTLF